MVEGTNLYKHSLPISKAYSIPQFTLKEKGKKGKPHFSKEDTVYPEGQVHTEN